MNSEGVGVAGGSGGVGGHTGKVPRMLRSHQLDAQHGVVRVEVDHGHASRVGGAGADGGAMPEPGDGEWLITQRHRARQRHPLTSLHPLTHGDWRYLWGD